MNSARRRFLKIIGVSVGAALLPGMSQQARPEGAAISWRGIVMNAPSVLHLYSEDEPHAQHALRTAVDEARRLERIFSLYLPDSAICRLNRIGRLANPPLELIQLLTEARAISEATKGGFDATIQPLWELYAAHFARSPHDSEGPSREAVARVRALIDYRRVIIGDDEISLARSGMSVSLNGIAQGYVTDRITELLRAEGFEMMSVDLGEVRLTGPGPSGGIWRIAIGDQETPDKILRRFDVREGAIATSQPAGTVFEPSGRHHHLFDPRTGRSVSQYRTVTVLAANAARADGLSTGLSILPPERLRAVLQSFADVRVVAQKLDGTWLDTLG